MPLNRLSVVISFLQREGSSVLIVNAKNAKGNPKNNETVNGFSAVIVVSVTCLLINLTKRFCKLTISFKLLCKITFVAPICVAFNIW